MWESTVRTEMPNSPAISGLDLAPEQVELPPSLEAKGSPARPTSPPELGSRLLRTRPRGDLLALGVGLPAAPDEPRARPRWPRLQLPATAFRAPRTRARHVGDPRRPWPRGQMRGVPWLGGVGPDTGGPDP